MSPRERALEQYQYLRNNPTPDGDTIDLQRVAQSDQAKAERTIANDPNLKDDDIRWKDVAKTFLKAGVRYAVNYGQKLYLMTKEGMQKLSHDTRHDSEMHYWANEGCHELHKTPTGLRSLAHRFMHASKSAVFAFQRAFKDSTVQPAYFSEAVPTDLVVDARDADNPTAMTHVETVEQDVSDKENPDKYPPLHLVKPGEKPMHKKDKLEDSASVINSIGKAGKSVSGMSHGAMKESIKDQAQKAHAPLQPDQSPERAQEFGNANTDRLDPDQEAELVKKLSDSLGAIGKVMGVKYIIANGDDSKNFNITIDDGSKHPSSFNLNKHSAKSLYMPDDPDAGGGMQSLIASFERGMVNRTAWQLDQTLSNPASSKEDRSLALSKLNAGESAYGKVFTNVMAMKEGNFAQGIDMTSEMVPSSTVVAYTQDEKTGMYKPITSGDVRESMEDALKAYHMDDLKGQAREEAKTILGNDYLDDAYKKASVHDVVRDDKIELDKRKQAEVRYYATSQDMLNENRVGHFAQDGSKVKDNSIILMQPNSQTGILNYYTVGDVKKAVNKDLEQMNFDPQNELAPNQKQAARDVLVQKFADNLQNTLKDENNMRTNLPLDQMIQSANQDVLNEYMGDTKEAQQNRARLRELADSIEPMDDSTLQQRAEQSYEQDHKPDVSSKKEDNTLQIQASQPTQTSDGKDNTLQKQASQPTQLDDSKDDTLQKASQPTEPDNKPQTNKQPTQLTNDTTLKEQASKPESSVSTTDHSLQDNANQNPQSTTPDDEITGFTATQDAPDMFTPVPDDPSFAG